MCIHLHPPLSEKVCMSVFIFTWLRGGRLPGFVEEKERGGEREREREKQHNEEEEQ